MGQGNSQILWGKKACLSCRDKGVLTLSITQDASMENFEQVKYHSVPEAMSDQMM